MPKSIYLINGPNLNRLGKRKPELYGSDTLEDVYLLVKEAVIEDQFEVVSYQSNHEGDLVDYIHEADEQAEGIIINPAAYTHTSIAIRDAIESISIPVVEVHITNIHSREQFRQHSMTAPVSAGQIVGFGTDGYRIAALGLIKLIREGRKNDV